jgi:outer membrane receptor for Fe3+-dicitrate
MQLIDINTPEERTIDIRTVKEKTKEEYYKEFVDAFTAVYKTFTKPEVLLYANNVEVKSFIISMDDKCMQFEVHTVDGEKRVIQSAWCKAVMDNPQEIIFTPFVTEIAQLDKLKDILTFSYRVKGSFQS